MEGVCYHLQGRVMKAEVAFIRCRESTGDPARFKVEWEFFLVALNGVFDFIHAASKGQGKLEPWCGTITRERRKDPLLLYLHQARNAEQHGLNAILNMQITTSFRAADGSEISVKRFKDASGEPVTEVWAASGAPVIAERRGPEIVLTPVTDSVHKDTFQPPKEHLGARIQDPSPLGVGRLGLDYYKRVAEEFIQRASAQTPRPSPKKSAEPHPR